MAKELDTMLSQKFVCAKCERKGAKVDRLAMTGAGLSRFFDIQNHRFAFVSCHNCGYTEVYNLRTLEGKDNAGTLLDVLFGG